MGLGALGLSNSAIHAFAVALQGVMLTEVRVVLFSPSQEALMGKVVTLSFLHLRFIFRVVVDG